MVCATGCVEPRRHDSRHFRRRARTLLWSIDEPVGEWTPPRHAGACYSAPRRCWPRAAAATRSCRFSPPACWPSATRTASITSEFRKYTVNALSTDANGVKTISCDGNSLWVQRLAADFGLVFQECPGTVVDPLSRIYAEAGDTKVADLAAQVDQHLATDTFSGKDLVTLFTGQNDVLEQYAQYPGVPKAQLLSNVYEAGLALARAGQPHRGSPAARCWCPPCPTSPIRPSRSPRTPTPETTRVARCWANWSPSSTRACAWASPRSRANRSAIMRTDELVQAMAKFPVSYGGMTNVIAPVCDTDAGRHRRSVHHRHAGDWRRSLSSTSGPTTNTSARTATSISARWPSHRSRANPF